MNKMFNLLIITLGAIMGMCLAYAVDKREQKQERLRKKSERRKRWRERDK